MEISLKYFVVTDVILPNRVQWRMVLDRRIAPLCPREQCCGADLGKS
jgi:hypothetical protein